MRVFLDNASTTPIDSEVIEAMTAAMHKLSGNPSSIHKEGRTARSAIEESRKIVANTIDASIGEIFFTSGGTESNNMALKCAIRDLGVKRIISEKLEHHAVLHTLDYLKKHNSVEIVYLDIDNRGVIDLEHLEALLSEKDVKTLVSVMHSNNEIGTLNNVQRISEICDLHKAYFHTDMVQTMGYFPINVSKMKVSFVSGSAHKFYGPKGTGFIYINGDNIIKPFIDGGAQERNMRGGTENTYGIIGLGKALEKAVANMDERRVYIESLRTYLKIQLSETFEDIQFNGDQENYHYKVLSVSFPPSPKAELLLFNLDISGISASGGSACSSGIDVGSHVLAGINEPDDRATIRFSFSYKNTVEELDFLVEKLRKIVELKKAVMVG
ncbi:MAG: cysteine desulfurase [Saprospiraceae bacterium]|jgi:cysteine desulfurase